MKGGEIVNLFSEFIKEKANADLSTYEKIHKKFWTSKKLQREWKVYKDNMLKDIFVPQRQALSFSYGQNAPPSRLPTSMTPLIPATPAKKRGRPKGSKNKIQTPRTPAPKEEMDWFEMESPPVVRKTLFISPEANKKIAERKTEFQERLEMGMEDFPIGGTGFEDWLPFIRKNYPPVIRKFLEQRGNEIIEKLTIGRTPLEATTNLLLQTVTAITMRGEFARRQKEKNYDDLFHLELIITTTRGTYFSIEKNEVINIRLEPKLKTNTQLKEIPQESIPKGLTINKMLENAQKKMKNKFFVYNAVTNNCQDFILALLESNNIGTQEDKEFIKQDVPYLFEGAKKTMGFASLLTSIAAIRNRLIEGEGMYKVQSVLFDKNKWDSPNKAEEWLTSHSYLNKGIDEKENTYRFRQLNPSYVRKQGYKRFITKNLGDSGVSIILAYK
jgi:hypothetical protein